jgi:hypothetical protein
MLREHRRLLAWRELDEHVSRRESTPPVDCAALEFLMPPLDTNLVQELRALLTDLRNASDDGRMLAERYTQILRGAVDEYCVEFDKRAEAILKKLDDAA